MMRQHQRIVVAVCTLAGCAGTLDGTSGDDDDDDQPPVCAQSRTYLGFDGTPLEANRPAIAAGSDRLRLKPFVALATEYQRALALTTFDTKAFAATFGKPPARWFSEPQASANTVYAAFALAFDACSQHTATDAAYANVPNAADADLLCHEHARKAWHREATAEETTACMTYTLDETLATDSPQRRWAYSCAAVLTASDFLAY